MDCLFEFHRRKPGSRGGGPLEMEMDPSGREVKWSARVRELVTFSTARVTAEVLAWVESLVSFNDSRSAVNFWSMET